MSDFLNLTTPSCRDDYDALALPPDVALQRILDAVTPLGQDSTECVALRESLGRVLSEDLLATVNVPAHDNSAMDGYALRSDDLPQDGTRLLRIVGTSLAGHPFREPCGRGECVRIMTGAVVPAGTDTVVPQEHVERVDACVIRIDGRTGARANVRAAGEDIRCGQRVLPRGRRIRAADLGLIASLGMPHVSVMRRPRVAFFSTGDELRSVGEVLQPGEIFDSNRYTLCGMLVHQQCEFTDLGVVPDDPTALRAVLQSAAAAHDVIITSGGVSVGEADHVRQVLSEEGSVAFWKVAMKPGRPLTFGQIGHATFFGLPGNPVAVMVSFGLFVQPALQRLAGEAAAPRLSLRAVCTSALKKRAGRTEYQRGILSQQDDGSLTVCKTGPQGSGVLTSMSRANCFIVLSADQTHVEPGTPVRVETFAGWLE